MRDRVMEAYYADVRNSELLSVDEERALFVAYRTCTRCEYAFLIGSALPKCPQCRTARNFKARDRLVQGALRFVLKVAKTYARRTRGLHYTSDLLQSLISAGNLGLLIAVDRFEPARKTRFLTYAAWWVREKIMEELDHQGLVRVPAYRQKALRAQRKMRGVTPETAHVVLEEVKTIDHLHRDERLETDLMNTYGTALVQRALLELGFRGRDKYIVLVYFGLREDPKNLRQISDRLNLSSERVRQIKQDVLDRLKAHLAERKVTQAHDLFAAG